MTVPTEEGVKRSYVYKKPILTKRKDVGSEFPNMRFGKADKPLLREVSKRDFAETPSVGRKDRRYVKRMKKKPKY